MQKIIDSLDNKPLVEIDGRQFIINPLTEQIPCTEAELLREACEELVKKIDQQQTTKLVTEEDKGAILLAGVSLLTGLPFGMARWQPSRIAGQVKESFKMEYTKGDLYLNGIEKGDRVTIVDDLVSSGGTLIALIKTIEKVGAEIIGIICIAEKVDYQGCERIKKETGHEVQTLLKIDMSGEKSRVIK
ncbi:adenine phosphoribosyltransferase [Patescibacteria group bacterium]|nr:adenine phosphoribosyltransferase [Patescibacteria group bacterium]